MTDKSTFPAVMTKATVKDLSHDGLTATALHACDGRADDAFALLVAAAYAALDTGRKTKRGRRQRARRGDESSGPSRPLPSSADEIGRKAAGSGRRFSSSSAQKGQPSPPAPEESEGSFDSLTSAQAAASAACGGVASSSSSSFSSSSTAARSAACGSECGDPPARDGAVGAASQAGGEGGEEGRDGGERGGRQQQQQQQNQPLLNRPVSPPPGFEAVGGRDTSYEYTPTSSVPFSDGDSGIGPWKVVQRREAAGRRGGDAYGPTSSQSGPGSGQKVLQLQAGEGGPGGVGEGGAGRREPDRRNDLRVLGLPPKVGQSELPQIPEKGERTGVLGDGGERSGKILGKSQCSDAPGVFDQDPTPGCDPRGRATPEDHCPAVTRVFLPDTAHHWQQAADAANDAHLAFLLAQGGGGGGGGGDGGVGGGHDGEWEDQTNDLFHLISATSQGLLSIQVDRDPSEPDSFRRIEQASCPDVVVGGLSLAEVASAKRTRVGYVESCRPKHQRRPYPGEALPPTLILPHREYDSVRGLLSDAPNVPLQVVELRGLRGIGYDRDRRAKAFGAFEGRRCFLIRGDTFQPAHLQAGRYLRAFVHTEQWGRLQHWAARRVQGGFRIIGADITLVGADGGRRPCGRYPGHPKFDVRKALTALGVVTYGGSSDWGTIPHLPGSEEAFPLAIAASSGRTGTTPSPIHQLRGEFMGRFAGSEGLQHAPRLRVRLDPSSSLKIRRDLQRLLFGDPSTRGWNGEKHPSAIRSAAGGIGGAVGLAGGGQGGEGAVRRGDQGPAGPLGARGEANRLPSFAEVVSRKAPDPLDFFDMNKIFYLRPVVTSAADAGLGPKKKVKEKKGPEKKSENLKKKK